MNGEQIKALSGAQWQRIVEILGSGEFLGIEFRPPREDEEWVGRANGIRTGGWWLCTAKYSDMKTDEHGGVIFYQEVTRTFPFRLFELEDDE